MQQQAASPQPLLAGYLTAQQLADELGVDIRTIWRWRWARKAPPAYKLGGRLMFKKSEVEDWVAQQREGHE